MSGLPDPETVVLSLLRAAGGQVVSRLAFDALPFTLLTVVSGIERHPLALAEYLIELQSWASTSVEASDLAEASRVALLSAWRRQTVVAGPRGGSLSRYRCALLPVRLPSDRDDAVRYRALYTLTFRPA